MSRLFSHMASGTSTRLRIWLSVAAMGTGRVVMVAYNFFLVPILLSAWGINVYGEWVVLSAFASIAQLSNVGFLQASASEIIMRLTAGEHDEAARVISTTLISVCVLVVVVFAVAVIVLFNVDPTAAFGVKIIPAMDARLIVLLSLASVLLSFYTGPPASAIAAVAGAGVAQSTTTIVKAGELLLVIAVAWCGGGPVAVTAVLVLSALVSFGLLMLLMRRLVPWMKVSVRLFDLAILRRLLHPSLGQFLLYASVNVVAIQLPRIVLGQLAGGAGVAVFSISVTYARAARMLTSVLAPSFLVELTRAYSEGKFPLTRKFVETICALGGWLTAFAAVLMLVAAKFMFHLWTHGKIDADYTLIGVLEIAAVVGAYSEGYTYFLAGINRVWTISIAHLVVSVSAIALGILVFPVFAIQGFAAALFLPEIAMAIAGEFVSAKELQVSRWTLFWGSIQLPVRSLGGEARRAFTAIARVFSVP